MNRLAVFAVCAALGFAAFAEGLPTAENGVITIDGEVTVSDSEGAAALAAATGLVLNEGAVLTYTATDDLALSANVSGTGTFKATSSGKVTLSGDNSGLVSPGHFEFDEACVAVLSEYGLGSSDTATATFKHSTVNKCVTFGTTTGVLTNHVAMSFTAKDGRIIGSEGANATFVQAADFTVCSGGTFTLYFDYNVSFVAGTFTHTGNGRFNASHSGDVRFTDDVDVVFGSQMIIYNSNIYFAPRSLTTGNGFMLQPVGGKNFQIATPNLLSSKVILQAYSSGLSGKYFNFCGCDQEFGHLAQSWNGTAGVVFYTDADKPVLLKACDAATGSNSYVWDFKGPISYWHDTTFVNEFKTSRITSTGDLTVSKGELRFASGSGWAGKNVTVKSGGTLTFDSTESLTSGEHVLTVEAGGTLGIADGVTLNVAEAQFGSVKLDAGETYTADAIRSLITGEDVTLTGDGSVNVVAVWNGWPDVGTATRFTVPSGLSVFIEESDIPKVEALEEIVLGKQSTVTFAVAGQPLDISAKITGSGMFLANGAGKVTLSGDNAITSPGCFKFTATGLHLGHPNALGGAAAGMAEYDKDGGLITFTYVNDCFTNNTPLKLTKTQSKLGSDDVSRFFVQNADLTLVNEIYFQNNFEMCHGTLNSTGGTPYWRHTTGAGGKVRLTGDTVTSIPNKQIVYFTTGLEIGGVSYSAPGGIATDSSANITFMKDFILSEQTCLVPYAQAAANSTAAYYNMNGHSQTIAYLGNSTAASFAIVRSAAGPCTLATVTSATGEQYAPYVFRDAISYSNGCNKVHTFKALHASTGDLWVTKGGVTFLPNGASGGGWSGVNVTVSGEGVLDCQSSVSLSMGSHNLVVRDGGTLKIAEGVTLKVQEASFGSVKLDYSKVYTTAEIRTLIEAAGENVTVLGDGTVQMSAKSIPGTWEGWPDVGTATRVEVPDNTVVTMTADDLAKMLALKEIEMGQNARIVIGDDVSETPIELTPNFIGAGKVCVYGKSQTVTNVIVRGDNSGLISPAGFLFSNTWAVVASRYGLGCEKTAAAEFYPAAPFTTSPNRSRLTFTEQATTNDVALSFAMGCLCGYDSPDVEFIQTGSMKGASQSVNQDNCRVGFFNRFTVTGGDFNCIFVRIHTDDSVLTLADGCTVALLNGFYGGGTVYLDSTTYASGMFELGIEQTVKRIVFTAENAFRMSLGGYLNFYDHSAASFSLDLNGYDQTLAALRGNSYWNANQQNLTITSAEPATLTLNGTTSRSAAVKCIDQVSLTYAGTATQTVGCATSTSTGALTVDSGAVRFERNAKWTTGSVVLNGGELIVEPNAATNTFGTGRSSAHLVVTGDGKLNLISDEYVSTVRTLTVDGELKDRGIYSAANCGFIKGPGSIRVMKDRPQGVLLLVR